MAESESISMEDVYRIIEGMRVRTLHREPLVLYIQYRGLLCTVKDMLAKRDVPRHNPEKARKNLIRELLRIHSPLVLLREDDDDEYIPEGCTRHRPGVFIVRSSVSIADLYYWITDEAWTLAPWKELLSLDALQGLDVYRHPDDARRLMEVSGVEFLFQSAQDGAEWMLALAG